MIFYVPFMPLFWINKYQLEQFLNWLQNLNYCNLEVFIENLLNFGYLRSFSKKSQKSYPNFAFFDRTNTAVFPIIFLFLVKHNSNLYLQNILKVFRDHEAMRGCIILIYLKLVKLIPHFINNY
ncbi:hypothetical protein ACKWTF_000087 [Chironomus riparius]